MSASRRVLETVNRPYAAAVLDAAVERQARRGTAGSTASPDPTPSFAEPYREAHLESVSPRTAPSTLSASALERLGAHLAADENFGRQLSKDAARALNSVNYLTDRERHLLAGLDKRAWGALVEASDKFKVAVGKRAAAGVPAGSSQLGDYLNGFKLGVGGSANSGDPAGGGSRGAGFGFTNPLRGKSRPSSATPYGPGSGPSVPSGTNGKNPFGPPGRGGAASLVPGFGSQGIEDNGPNSQGGLAPPVPTGPRQRPAGSVGDLVTHGDMAPPEQSEYGRFQYDDKRRDEAKLDAGQSLGDPAVNRLIRELTKALQEVLSEEGHDFLVEQDELDALNAQIPPNPYGEEEPPPPDPDTNNPNPEDPRGPRPSGPWERGRSQQGRNNPAAQIGRYNPAGLSSVPNDFDPRGPGPVGPWSSGPSRGAYYATGRYAVPNDFDPRGPRPAGPLSRGLSRPTYGSYRGDGDVMPNPEADPGHGGSVGPAS